jgi:copper homeostasis protein
LEGTERLKSLHQHAGSRLAIIVGGGVRSENIVALNETLKANFYHSACITQVGGEADEQEIKRILEVFQQ